MLDSTPHLSLGSQETIISTICLVRGHRLNSRQSTIKIIVSGRNNLQEHGAKVWMGLDQEPLVVPDWGAVLVLVCLGGGGANDGKGLLFITLN